MATTTVTEYSCFVWNTKRNEYDQLSTVKSTHTSPIPVCIRNALYKARKHSMQNISTNQTPLYDTNKYIVRSRTVTTIISQWSDVPALNQSIPERTPSSPIDAALLQECISCLNLTTRTYNSLRRCNIATIQDLVKLTPRELSCTRSIGEKSIVEIQRGLYTYGLALAVDAPDE